MSVIQFPGGRYAPPAPTADTLAEELRALEIELARARLAQINFEVRQAKALWAWFWCKRILAAALVLWLVSTFAGA